MSYSQHQTTETGQTSLSGGLLLLLPVCPFSAQTFIQGSVTTEGKPMISTDVLALKDYIWHILRAKVPLSHGSWSRVANSGSLSSDTLQLSNKFQALDSEVGLLSPAGQPSVFYPGLLSWADWLLLHCHGLHLSYWSGMHTQVRCRHFYGLSSSGMWWRDFLLSRCLRKGHYINCPAADWKTHLCLCSCSCQHQQYQKSTVKDCQRGVHVPVANMLGTGKKCVIFRFAVPSPHFGDVKFSRQWITSSFLNQPTTFLNGISTEDQVLSMNTELALHSCNVFTVWQLKSPDFGHSLGLSCSGSPHTFLTEN